MVGFFTRQTGLLAREAVEQAVRESLRPKLVPLNLKALAIGYEYE